MEAEMRCLKENDAGTWKKYPVDKNAIKSKWMFKLKNNADKSIQRYKARQ